MSLVLDEPVELRDQMRSVGAEAPSQLRSMLAEAIAMALADAFRLAGQPGEEIDLEDVCMGYQRELWLWFIGERTWAQCQSGLAGRVSRRARALAEL